MGKARSWVAGGLIGAAIGVVLAPRHGESRREALGRLRLAARPGRGALGAFAGTPCSVAGRPGEPAAAEPAEGGGPAGQEGDGDG